jgi:hypothetical protein
MQIMIEFVIIIKIVQWMELEEVKEDEWEDIDNSIAILEIINK